jgi:hypothetical protein
MGMWLRAKLRASRDVLAAKLRVDEAVFKSREFDELAELIKSVRAAKKENVELDL